MIKGLLLHALVKVEGEVIVLGEATAIVQYQTLFELDLWDSCPVGNKTGQML